MSGASAGPETFAEAIAEARAAGFEVIEANANTLLLDLDTPEAEAQFDRVLPIAQEHFGAGVPVRWKSKSGKAHVSLSVEPPLEHAVRYLLQAALGSDGVREALHQAQRVNGCAEPCVLFRPTARSRRKS